MLSAEHAGTRLSGDSPDHSRERQFEDVAAFARSIGEPVALFGHSSGAVWALGGAALSPADVRALALYEPPFPALDPPMTDDQLARMTSAVTEDRLADGVQVATEEIIGLGADEIALFSLPGVAERAQAMLPLVVEEAPEVNRPFDETVLESALDAGTRAQRGALARRVQRCCAAAGRPARGCPTLPRSPAPATSVH